jgi:hypothetical protein
VRWDTCRAIGCPGSPSNGNGIGVLTAACPLRDPEVTTLLPVQATEEPDLFVSTWLKPRPEASPEAENQAQDFTEDLDVIAGCAQPALSRAGKIHKAEKVTRMYRSNPTCNSLAHHASLKVFSCEVVQIRFLVCSEPRRCVAPSTVAPYKCASVRSV